MNKPVLRFDGFSDEWENHKLGDASETFEYGLNVAATTYDGVHKYIRITDIDDETRIYLKSDITTPDYNLSNLENYRLKEGDIVFARTGASVGKTYIYRISDGAVYYAGFLIRARIKPNYSAEFIFQNTLTKKYEQFICINSQRSGQPGVNAQEYSNFEITTPKLEEQQKIGSFFRALDRLISSRQKRYDKLLGIKAALLQKMFPKQGESVPEIRFEGFCGEWEGKKIAEIARFSKGHGYSKSDITDVGTPIILYGRMYTNYQCDISCVDTFCHPKPNSIYSTGKEVIIPASGETAEDISIASAVKKSGIILGGDLNIVTPFENTVDTTFLALSISNGKPKKTLSKKAQGKTVVHIHNFDIQEVVVDLPSLPEQQKIGSLFHVLDRLISLCGAELDKLKNIKKSCLEKMFV